MASIKATVTDSDALKKITPEMLAKYLQAHGWKWDHAQLYSRVEPAPGCGYWRIDTDKPWDEVVVPIEGYHDYSHRVSDAIRTLAQFEGRSQLDIYCEIVGKPTYEELEAELAAHKLALSVACDDEETSGGGCPLKDGSLLRCPFGNRYGDAACCEKEDENCYPALLLVWAWERLKGGPDWWAAKHGKEGE